MSQQTILVTGGAGFIGSHTCKALSARNLNIIAYDNLSRGNRRAVQWGPLIVGDILDSRRLEEVVATHRPDAVIHFAALAYVGESVAEPAEYHRHNVVGTLNVLDACRRGGVKAFVFSSSCATYGIPETLPIKEGDRQSPINPYGRSKWIGEQFLADYGHAYDFKYVALRYFNACGADPEGEIGEWHDPETHLIPRALMAAAGRIPHLTVYGDDYDTPDGTCLRDYVHVSDIARAHVLALDYLLQGGNSGCYNLGAGRCHSVNEIITAVETHTGRKVPIKVEPRRAGDPPVLYADPRSATEILGFSAQLSDLKTIISTAAPWFLSPPVRQSQPL
jgi:UDP-arabinose 4-epimerase